MAISLNIIDAGQIGTYTDLVNKVASWLDRDDLTAQIPDFVAMLEARLNRLLRTVNQEFKDLWVVSAESFDLPADFRKLRKIHIEGSPDRPLVEMSPTAIATQFGGGTGTPRAYWIEGRTISFAPPPAAATTFRSTYWRKIVPLTTNAPQNWLLNEHPDIYVWGTLHQAAIYIRDPDAIITTKDYLDEAIAELQRESRLDRWGGGPLVPNGPAQIRFARS